MELRETAKGKQSQTPAFSHEHPYCRVQVSEGASSHQGLKYTDTLCTAVHSENNMCTGKRTGKWERNPVT